MATLYVWIFSVCNVLWLITSVDSEVGYYQLDLTRKPTQQSSTKGGAVSSRAVDGNPDSVFHGGSCTHTNDTGLNWWAVDLISEYAVYSVTLVNRGDCCGNRLDKFIIYGYNKPFDPNQSNEKETCAELSGDFGESDTRTFVCSHLIHSRCVGVQLTKGNPLSLCEVYIRVACEQGKYGDNCSNSCSEHCKFYPCERDTGACPNTTCTAGFKGDTCDTPCPNGQYGENCINTCSPNCRDSPCNKRNGNCPNGECNAGFKGVRCDEEIKATKMEATTAIQTYKPTENSQENTGTSSNTGVIAGAIAGVAVLVLIVLIAVLIIRKRKSKSHTDATNVRRKNSPLPVYKNVPVPKPRSQLTPIQRSDSNASDQEVLDESENVLDIATDIPEGTYANVVGEESKLKLKLGDIGPFMKSMENQANPFADEYNTIPKATSSWKESSASELKSKNRYINILPYDYNRVKLCPVANDPVSTYINASFIKDYDGQTAYIASLGTTNRTIEDTWRMIWETDISHIIMVTNLVEDSKTKCIQYWPSGKSAQYGEIAVFIEKEESHAHWVKRTMKASVNKNSRVITHYHYTVWPDKQAPSNLSSVLQLREIVKNIRIQKKIPILIHCSAGIGRTGTLIALDILLDQADKEGAIDVYKCVTRLREQRTQMVQTVGQYAFLYYAFHEITQVGRTSIAAKNIMSHIRSANFQGHIAKEFKFLESIKPRIKEEYLVFGRADNIEKNRDQNVIASDEQRVTLMSNPDIYINAVYVPDYCRTLAFCATQLPLEDTVGHFWMMMYELKCPIVVCLETDNTDSWKWIPDKSQPIVGENIYVGLKDTKEEHSFRVHHIYLSTKIENVYANVQLQPEGEDFHQLKLFVFTSWTSDPLNGRDLGSVKSVLKQAEAFAKVDRRPTTVMCRNGASETGLYIALSILVDTMKSEQEVDVFQVVKLIRMSRPEFITSQEQYNWLYQCIAHMSHK